MTSDYFVLFVLASLSSRLFIVAKSAEELTPEKEEDIIKNCNGIQYRLMVDWGVPPFPGTACEVKKVRLATDI